MFQAVIFDIDGVLNQTENIHMQAVSMLFERVYGYELNEDDLKLVVGRHHTDYASEIIKLHSLDSDPAKFAQIMSGFAPLYDSLWDQKAELLPGVRETLSELRTRGVRLSLASNGTEERIMAFIERFKFKGVFEQITTGEEVAKKKPDPQIYIIARGKLGLPDGAILVAEDSEPGVLAAKAAGLHVAAIYNEYTAYQNFNTADYHLKSLSEILALF